MLSKLSLVIPLVSNSRGLNPTFMLYNCYPHQRSFYLVQSTIQAVRFQLLHTPPNKIHFAGDLKYGILCLSLFFLVIHCFENTFGSEPMSGTILKAISGAWKDDPVHKWSDLLWLMIYLAVGDVEVREKELNTIKDLQRQFNDRPIWMAASVHRGEEEGKHARSAPFAIKCTNIICCASAVPVNCTLNQLYGGPLLA